MIWLVGTYEIQVAGTATGVFQFDGTAIMLGIVANELAGTDTTFVNGTVTIKTEGTELGTLEYEIITAFD
jgi:hypothetical protein